jgi:hypothetical protein
VISTASNGQEAIGSTTSVKPQAEANTRTLSNGSSVYSKELIHTGDSGVASLRFHDNSNLSVGPKSSVRLDKFVYDPNKSIGSVAVEAARGSFRFATGSQSNGSHQVKTPYGTLGIRGWTRPRLSPKAFTQAKKQLRQEVSERVERDGAMTDQIITDIWTDALGYLRDYVARTAEQPTKFDLVINLTTAKAAEVILDNLSKRGRSSHRRVGVAFPAGLRKQKDNVPRQP